MSSALTSSGSDLAFDIDTVLADVRNAPAKRVRKWVTRAHGHSDVLDRVSPTSLAHALAATRRASADPTVSAARSAALAELETALQDAMARQRVAAQTTRAEEIAQRLGPLQRDLLLALAAAPAVPRELTPIVARDASSVSRALADLLKAGHVAYVTDAEDKRLRRYSLTSSGATLSTQLSAFHPAPPQARPLSIETVLAGLRESLDRAVALRRRAGRRHEVAGRLGVLVEESQRLGDPDLALDVRKELVTTLRHARLYTEAREQLQLVAAEVATATGTRALAAWGHVEYEFGRLPGASLPAQHDHLVAAERVFARLAALESSEQWTQRQAWAMLSIGENLRQRGHYDAALGHAARAHRLFRTIDDLYGATRTTFVIGFCLRLRGQFSVALTILQRAHEMALEHGFGVFAADAEVQVGDAMRCAGDSDAAVTQLEHATASAVDAGLPVAAAFAQSALGAARHVAGDPAGARSVLAEAHAAFTRNPHAEGTALTEHRQAVVAREIGTKSLLADAVDLTASAQQRYEDIGSPAGVAACLIESGNLAIRRGRSVTAACAELRALLTAPRIRNLVELDPWVPALLADFAAAAPPREGLAEIAADLRSDGARVSSEQATEVAAIIDFAGAPAIRSPEALRPEAAVHLDAMAGEHRRLEAPMLAA